LEGWAAATAASNIFVSSFLCFMFCRLNKFKQRRNRDTEP
jgi:hypothetical protein